MESLEGIGVTFGRFVVFAQLADHQLADGVVQVAWIESAADRLLATRLGAHCAGAIEAGESGVMIAARGEESVAVPLKDVVGKRKSVPLDHTWIRTARRIGVSLGDA